jgi:hypothetical protein
MSSIPQTAPVVQPVTEALLDSIEQYNNWLEGVPVEVYEDESPELADAEMFDDGPLFPPTEDDLDLLLSQRAACEALPETLAALDESIGQLRRSLLLTVVARFLERTRVDGHDA